MAMTFACRSSLFIMANCCNAIKVLSLTPFKDENQLIKSLHLECTANRERENLDVHLPVRDALIG